MPLHRDTVTVSRLATASESAFASGGSGLAAMGAGRRIKHVTLSAYAAVSESASPREPAASWR